MRSQAFRLQFLENGDRLSFRPDHADIACRSLRSPAQHAHVVVMAAGDDDDVRRLAGGKFGGSLVEIFGDHLLRVGEAIAIGVGFTIVDYGYVESGDSCNLIKAGGGGAGTENVEIGRGQDGLDKNLEGSAANQTGIVLWVLIQIESQSSGPLRFHHFASCLPYLGFYAAAADGSDYRAIVADQHFGGLEGRDRSADVDDGGYGTAASVFAQADDLFVEVHADDYWGGAGASQLKKAAPAVAR